MFTGIITDIGEITAVEKDAGDDLHLTIKANAPLDDVAIGASISCSGICLTVVKLSGKEFSVDVSAETVARSVPGMWEVGRKLNLERALKVGDELGGHIVTGHVDGVGTVTDVQQVDGSLNLVVRAPADLAPAIARKGSVAADGVSLTVNDVQDLADGPYFHLNIIPHTAECTTFAGIKVGTEVNLEIDVLARYLQRMQDVKSH